MRRKRRRKKKESHAPPSGSSECKDLERKVTKREVQKNRLQGERMKPRQRRGWDKRPRRGPVLQRGRPRKRTFPRKGEGEDSGQGPPGRVDTPRKTNGRTGQIRRKSGDTVLEGRIGGVKKVRFSKRKTPNLKRGERRGRGREVKYPG